MGEDEKAFWRRRFLSGRTPKACRNGPCVWFHAASVGEVTGGLGVIGRLPDVDPQVEVFLSVGTPQGYRFARSHVPKNVQVFEAPMDVPWAVWRTVTSLRPDVFVTLESEFWPLLHWCLRKHGIPVVLLNGRVSEKSWRQYRRFFFIFGHVFRSIQWACVNTVEDQQRLVTLGVSPQRITVTGSAKYDTLTHRADPSLVEAWRRRLGLSSEAPALVAGSLRGEECQALLEIFIKLKRECPRLVGIFAPRHLDRVASMIAWLQGHGVPYDLLSSFLSNESQRRQSDCLVVDGIGHLFELYGLGHFIFCGGTLAPVGGHNIVEPLAWGKTVYYGPHVEKVWEEQVVLQRHGAGIMVHSPEDLYGRWRHALLSGAFGGWKKDAARKALEELGGAAERQLTSLQPFLWRAKAQEASK
ncbi:3-deoxy-D-manno-octulosonic acid transferase [Desulfosoma caldarium]|uniref:3-deoxy-D-manno-octulosonic acid transferase n=1 Tax=Desulfosoma caldarium TaxID=610254 RepID=A0A3N1UIC7_9BACT|nr:glycosyltransferase N-terminal domain-containing protein [Desulfosoma caldarium]ROQ89528.1 3-deoxy-D-manno-octulosonic-acid transferase [Desulfosoma caldarium]